MTAEKKVAERFGWTLDKDGDLLDCDGDCIAHYADYSTVKMVFRHLVAACNSLAQAEAKLSAIRERIAECYNDDGASCSECKRCYFIVNKTTPPRIVEVTV